MAGIGLFKQLKSFLGSERHVLEVQLDQPHRLGGSTVRISWDQLPFALRLPEEGLEFQIVPEPTLGSASDAPVPSALLFDRRPVEAGIRGFLRLVQGEPLIMGGYDRWQSAMFGYPSHMGLRFLSIEHDGDALLFKTDNSLSGRCRTGTFSERFVYLSPGAAQFCVDRKLGLIGVDYITIERYGDEAFPAHRTILGKDILVLEGIDLGNVPPGRYTLFCFPLKIKDGEASPVRAILFR